MAPRVTPSLPSCPLSSPAPQPARAASRGSSWSCCSTSSRRRPRRGPPPRRRWRSCGRRRRRRRTASTRWVLGGAGCWPGTRGAFEMPRPAAAGRNRQGAGRHGPRTAAATAGCCVAPACRTYDEPAPPPPLHSCSGSALRPLQGAAVADRLRAEVAAAREDAAEMRAVRWLCPWAVSCARAAGAGVFAATQKPSTALPLRWLAQAPMPGPFPTCPASLLPPTQLNFALQEELEAQRTASAEAGAALAAAQHRLRQLEVGGVRGEVALENLTRNKRLARMRVQLQGWSSSLAPPSPTLPTLLPTPRRRCGSTRRTRRRWRCSCGPPALSRRRAEPCGSLARRCRTPASPMSRPPTLPGTCTIKPCLPAFQFHSECLPISSSTAHHLLISASPCTHQTFQACTPIYPFDPPPARGGQHPPVT